MPDTSMRNLGGDTQRHWQFDATEWVTHNMHRNFPIIDDIIPSDVTGKILPSSFLGGLAIECYPIITARNSDFFYIARVVQAGSYITVEIGYTPEAGSDSFICGKATGISTSLRSGDPIEDRTFTITPVTESIPSTFPELNYLTGTLIVGTCQDISGVYLFQGSDSNGANMALHTQISPLCRSLPLDGVSSLVVELDDGSTRVLSGDVVLEAGDGIAFSIGSDSTSDETVLEIRRVPMQGSDTPINTLDDAIKALKSALGNPVTMINGVRPDSDGNIDLVTEPGCLTVEGGDTGFVSITNTCATPCCGDVSDSDMETTIKQLEQARDRLIGYYESISASITALQARLASLVASAETAGGEPQNSAPNQ